MTKYLFPILLLVLFLGCEREITQSAELEVNPVNGKVFISSSPQGSEIYLNGKIQGKYTPDSLFWLDEKEFTITLKRPLYRDTSFFVSPQINDPDSRFIDYLSNPLMYGRIRCLTEPSGAEIFLNDSATGKFTPDTLRNLLPGKYRIRYEKKDFRAPVLEYLVSSNETPGNFHSLEDTSVWVSYASHNSPIKDDRILAVENDLDGNIWFASEYYGLAKFDRKSWKFFTAEDHPVLDFPSYSLAVDSNNVLWIGSSQGLLKYENEVFTYYNTTNSQLPGDQVYHLKVDAENRVWVSTYGGIVKIENDVMKVYSTENNNSDADYVNCIETRGSEEVWAGHVKSIMTTLSDDYFYPVLPDWVETDPDIFLGTTVSSIAAEKNGNLWIGFYPEYRPGGGVGGFALKVNSLWFKDFLPQVSREINEIFISNSGEKFIATSAGLTIFDNWENRKFYTAQNSGLYSNEIHDICADNAGVIWLATSGGLTKFKRHELR